MKNILLFFLFPSLAFSQYSFYYNQGTNTVTISYQGCDLCSYGNQSAVNSCLCWKACQNDQEINEDLQECYDYCTEAYGGYEYNPYQLALCNESCLTYYNAAISACASSNNCGTRPQSKEVYAIEYIIQSS
ncbi:MAG: hypothetical protein IPM92_12965 [Saprospiraceae bacterium]|nr:hypothetical protein [Saprospiraceae bacterium]